MATAWPEHEFLTLTKKPALYIDGRKLVTNTQKTQDGILKSYMYCQNKPACKASAIAIFLEGIIINIINGKQRGFLKIYIFKILALYVLKGDSKKKGVLKNLHFLS